MTAKTKNTMTTPAIKQFAEFKAKHPEDFLLFRMGDFYECFHEDAETLNKVCGVMITSRGDIRMAGVPFHAIEAYLRKLIAAGHRAAICDQIEPDQFAGEKFRLVNRESGSGDQTPQQSSKPRNGEAMTATTNSCVALFDGPLPKTTDKKLVDKTKPPFKVSPTLRICKDGHLWERDRRVVVPPYPFLQRHTANGLDGSEITHFTKDDSKQERKRRGVVLRKHVLYNETWWDIAEPLCSMEQIKQPKRD